MRVRRGFRIVPAFIVASALFLSACGGPAAEDGAGKETGGEIPSASSDSLVESATDEGELAWYTSNTRPAADMVARLFEKSYPGIEVNVFQAGGSQVTAKVEAEVLAGGIKADVVDYSDGAVAINQSERGLFERYLPEGSDQISDDLKDPDGYWFSPYFLTSTIVYNTEIVDKSDAPTSWKDLTDPKWKGKVAMASPDYAGTAVATIGTWEQVFDKDYIEALGANGLRVLEGFGNVHDAVLSGQTPIGVNLSFRAVTAEEEGEPMAYVSPEEGQIMLPSAAAVIAGSASPNAAKLFANFLLSDEIQSTMTETVKYFPAKEGAAAGVDRIAEMWDDKKLQGDSAILGDPQYVAEIKKLFKSATS